MRRQLLAWYGRVARPLPWRRTRDPFAIWVSEIMLQQTRVETVIPYWERFMARFPNPSALAVAHEDEVLALWSGLGYYRRARWLHAGAREVVERYGGEVPKDADARLALPGVGRYTAGAIGSIAFDLEEPIVDGNVARVLSRVHGISTPLGRADTERALWAAAEDIVVGARPGDLNQALMELGAIVCLPRRPRCAECPVSSVCRAFGDGDPERLPVPRKRRAPRTVRLVAVVVTRRGQVAVRRGEEALFGGLWGVPMLQESHGRDAARAAMRAAGLGGRVRRAPEGSLQHVLTHRRLAVEVWRATAGRAADDRVRWVSPAELEAMGISALTRKILTVSGYVLASSFER